MLRRVAASPSSRIASMLRRLPVRDRTMLALLYFEGLSVVETARALGCSVRDVERTVENRLAKFSALVAGALRARRRARREPRRLAA